MGSQVIHIIYNSELFTISKALSSPQGVVYVIHIPKLFIVSRAYNS